MTEKVNLVVPPAHSEHLGFNDSVLDEDALSLNSAATATKTGASEGPSTPSPSSKKHPKVVGDKDKSIIKHQGPNSTPANVRLPKQSSGEQG